MEFRDAHGLKSMKDDRLMEIQRLIIVAEQSMTLEPKKVNMYISI